MAYKLHQHTGERREGMLLMNFEMEEKMQKNCSRVRIIGAASGLGAQDRGCGDGPVAFHRSLAGQQLARHPRLDWGGLLFAARDEPAMPTASIAELCRHLALEVERAMVEGVFPLVIGGDHSVAIGTWGGVAHFAAAPVGLLWIDAHLDSHTPQTSHSGAIHGMPLACLLGRGDQRLLNIGLRGAQVCAAHTVVLGPRSYEEEELAFLTAQGVRILGAEDISRRGFADCLDEAAAIVSSAPSGFGVTLDLDAIDPHLAPGVGSPEPDGMETCQVMAALRRLSGLPGLRAVEIVEYNPDRDRHGMTARLISAMIGQILPAVTACAEK